jgi:uncharacterized protein
MMRCDSKLWPMLTLAAALQTPSALAQEASSWSSPPMAAPKQRPGDAQLLKNDAARRALKPTVGPSVETLTVPVAGDTAVTFKPAQSDAVRGSGILATTTVVKSQVGTDPAYDAFDQGRYLTAFELATAAAAAGGREAATLLGRLYQDGLGVKLDKALAAQWYRRGAELGDLEGTFAFAVLLADGDGIQKNRAGAAELFEAAAQKGHALANYNLAQLYFKGDGKPESPDKGALHLQYAAEQGVAAAQYDLATLYATGTGVPANAVQAGIWLEKAAMLGHTEAEVEFAAMLFQGTAVAPSQARGAALFRSAADKGNPIAQNRLARCYVHGTGVAQDPIEAAKWFLISRAGGVPDATLEALFKKLKPAERLMAEQAADAWQDAARLR